MSQPTMTAKAKAVETSLRQSGLTGIGWSKILQIITAFIGMFGACPVPLATRRMRNFGRNQWYWGYNQDVRSVNHVVENSGVLIGDGDNPAVLEDVVAAVKDVAGVTTVPEVTAMYLERG